MARIKIKRVYAPVEEDDGVRILVDRVWPRGLSKDKAKIDVWLRELAPSTDLCRWYSHVPERWPDFLQRYHTELDLNPQAVKRILELACQGRITLLFASGEPEKNNAMALKLYLEEKLQGNCEDPQEDNMGLREEFERRREQLNALVFKEANLPIKRLFALDSDVYADGALPRKTKELLGLVASLVLRCDDCVYYHLIQAKENGVRKEEAVEALAVALVVGGSIVIPHLRRAFALLKELWGE